jgi:ATP-binding cassette subfamily B protein
MQDNFHPFLRLWRYASPHHRSILLASIYSVVNKLFDLAPPILIGVAVDIVVQQENSILARWGVVDVRMQLVLLAVLTLIIWGFESIFEYLYAIKWRNLSQTVQHELRRDAYDHVQHLDMAYFEDRSTGGMMSVLNNDVNQLERFLDVGANQILQLLTTVLVVGGIFVALVPGIAWLAILPMPFIAYGSLRFQKLLAPRYAAVREQVGILNSILSGNLSGIATIKSFTAERHEVERIDLESDLYRQANRQAITLSSAFVPLIRMVIIFGFLAIMVFGGFMAINGALNVGAYSVLVFMTQRLLWPLTRLGETLDLYQRAMASTNRIFELLDTQSQIDDGAQTLSVRSVQGEVILDDVSFDYSGAEMNGSKPQQHVVIRNLSLHISAGETVGLVGATGAGKSTVVKLLLRFYDVKQGRVLLDGHDIRDLHIKDLRRTIGFVSQDVFLFHGTVRENIAYGTFDATDEEIIAAARVGEAHDFIMQLPDGYNTIVGERGQKLSGGQRQRISIARAVLKDPPVLILDEATSSVDNETEAAIQRSLERIAVGRTTIVIAHRLSTVRNANRIFVLEHGELREQGRHEDLIAAGGIYAGLWKVQTGRMVEYR